MIHFSRLTPRRQTAILNFLRWAAVLCVVFILSVVGYYLYVNVINLAPAEVYVAQRGTAIAAVYGTVTVNPLQTLSLFSQNSGYLHSPPDLYDSKNLKPEGVLVKKDQLLGTVYDENGQRLLRDAQLANQSALDRQKNGPPSANSLRTARDTLRAQESAKGNIPEVTLQGQRNMVSQLAAAVENEKLALQHDVDVAGSTLKAAQDQQSRTELRSPFDGILTFASAENTYFLPNQPVFAVATSQIYITGQVNEEDVGQLKADMKADISLYSFPAVTYPATVSQILPSPEANSSRYIVNLVFEPGVNTQDFRFGMTGQMNIILGKKANALIIQSRALTTNPDQILIVDDGVVAPRTIKLGLKSSEYTEVTDGISEGTQVIVSDQATFRKGERVRPVKVNNAKVRKRR